MAIFLDFPALVDLSVPERDGQLAQRLHYLVTGRGHVLHDQQTTRPLVAGPLGKPSGEAARKWVTRRGVPVTYCGRELRVDKRDVDRVLAADTRARRAS